MLNNQSKRIEVELRSMFDETKYNELASFFDKHAKDPGEDNKNVFFFILPDKLIKVVDNISKNTAKIVLKLNKIGKGSGFEEIEIFIQRQGVEKSVKLFISLGLIEVQNSFQKRHNYLYKNVEFALKHSKDWGYHLELEQIVNDKKDISLAEKKMNVLATELGLHIMTEKELEEFTSRKDEEHRNNKK